MISLLKLVPFTIDDVLQGASTKPVHYRIQVGQTIKYLKGPKPLSTLPDQSGDKLSFESVPEGSWTLGIMEIGSDGRFMLTCTENRALPDLMVPWHEVRVDLMDLGYAMELPMDSSGERIEFPPQLRGHVPSGIFKDNKVTEGAVVGLWNYDVEASYSEPLANESYIYSLLQGQSIAPRFVGHLTENNERTIGYVLEHVDGRRASRIDLEVCREVLQRLHNIGIVHGGIDEESFLITQGSGVRLQNFFNAIKTSDESTKKAEMVRLEEVLRE